MKQTNIEQFRIRQYGQYKGYTEGFAQWLENLETYARGRQLGEGQMVIEARDNNG